MIGTFRKGAVRRFFVGYVDANLVGHPDTWVREAERVEFPIEDGWYDWYVIYLAVAGTYTQDMDFEVQVEQVGNVDLVTLWLMFPDNNLCSVAGDDLKAIDWMDYPELKIVQDGDLKPAIAPSAPCTEYLEVSERVGLFLAGLYRTRYEEQVICINWRHCMFALVEHGLYNTIVAYGVGSTFNRDVDELFMSVLGLPDPDSEAKPDLSCAEIFRAFLVHKDAARCRRELAGLTETQFADFADEIVPFLEKLEGR